MTYFLVLFQFPKRISKEILFDYPHEGEATHKLNLSTFINNQEKDNQLYP